MAELKILFSLGVTRMDNISNKGKLRLTIWRGRVEDSVANSSVGKIAVGFPKSR